jgi:tetratricopeptide (TPR) repeat protein
MTNIRRLTGVVAAVLLAAQPVAAGWYEVWQADENLDLPSARALALETMTQDPAGADAVAAGMWWLANLDNLPDPEEPLTLALDGRDPELGFVLARLEAALRFEPPDGALTPAEVSGPFGVFSTLDLERAVVPPDDDLPALETVWVDQATPYRVVLRTRDGFFGPPASMAADGVFLVAWTIEVAEDTAGWMVVEAKGGYNLFLDGSAVDGRRECGVVDPATNWYSVKLAAGSHRIRLEVASPDSGEVRVSLVDDRGVRLDGVTVVEGVPAELAFSEGVSTLPPASNAAAALGASGEASAAELLLAACLATGRGDLQQDVELTERAVAATPDDPWLALALAQRLFREDGGAATGERSRRIGKFLREAGSIPGSRFLERAVAIREGRSDDAEKILDALADDFPEDARVLRIRVREAVRRGWAREGEDELELLEAELPGSHDVAGLRLEVLSALERWDEREQLLRALAAITPVDTRWVGQLASSCLVGEAVGMTEELRSSIDDPDFDVQVIRLNLEAGDLQAARSALDRARQRWGDLEALDTLALLLAADDRAALDRELAGALARHPSNLDLLTLSWRRGAQPFYAPFEIAAADFAAAHRDLGNDVDVVLLLDQAVERIFADGSSLYYYHGLTRANTPVGVRRASILEPLPDASFIKVRIIKPDGSVIVPSDLQGGEGYVALSQVEPGDLVEEEYVARVAATGATRQGHLPPYLYRFADENRAFGLSEYVLLVPPEIDLLVDGNFEGLERSEEEWQGLRKLDWRAERVPPMATEPFAPPAQDLMPWLNYGFGVTWQDVGDIVRDRMLPVLRTSAELRSWGRAAMSGTTPEEQLRSLVAALVETVEAGDGDLAVGSTAAASFSSRRGNRLGILAAVLVDAGWRVDLVLTRAWNERGNQLTVPTLDAFPVALLRVDRGDEEIWIDMREEARGVGHINPLFQGADGLVLPLSDPQRPVTLIDRLPTFANPDLVEEVTVKAVVSESGDARITFRLPLRGGQAEQLQQRVDSVPPDQVAMIYRQMAASLFPGADQVSGAIERGDDGAAILLELTAPRVCEPEDGDLVCRSLVLSNPIVPVLASLPERRYPLVLRLPIERRLQLDLVAPDGWAVTPRPPRRLAADWGSLEETLSTVEGVQRSVVHIVIPAVRVETADYAAFARFCQAVDELSTRPPQLEPEAK